MKKIIPFIILILNLTSNAQCPTPSNLIASGGLGQTTLSWTENGTATEWEIAVIPNYSIGDPIPNFGIITPSNPFILTGLPPVCNAFFVRSVCTSTNFSPWDVIGEGCSLNTYIWLTTLSNDSFETNSEKNKLQIYPNPTKNIIHIINNSELEKIKIFDYLGKEVLTQTLNNTEINVENLSNGIYLIEIQTENEKVYKKFIKE